MNRDTQSGFLLDALRWVSLAVFTAGTVRAAYLTVFGDGEDQSTSVVRLMVVALVAGVVMLWDLSRRKRS